MVIIIQHINEEPGFTHELESSAIVSFEQLRKIYQMAEHSQMAKHLWNYLYSSARYYELNEKNFSFKRFDGSVLR